MNRLNNKIILIGRESGQNRLIVAVKGYDKNIAVGNPGCVPNSVSRFKPIESVAHVKIEIDDKGDMTIYNMNPNNSTVVDGNEISIKKIKSGSSIELGKDRFRLNITTALDAAKKIVPSIPVNISHLKAVWEKYEWETTDHIDELRYQKEKNRMLPIMVSSTSGLISGIGAWAFSVSTLWVTLPITAIVSLLYFKNYNTKDQSSAIRKAANKELQHKYICPVCHKYLGAVSYDILKDNFRSVQDGKMYCPKCKCEFVEN